MKARSPGALSVAHPTSRRAVTRSVATLKTLNDSPPTRFPARVLARHDALQHTACPCGRSSSGHDAFAHCTGDCSGHEPCHVAPQGGLLR
jgi:hypothetical protein